MSMIDDYTNHRTHTHNNLTQISARKEKNPNLKVPVSLANAGATNLQNADQAPTDGGVTFAETPRMIPGFAGELKTVPELLWVVHHQHKKITRNTILHLH